MIDILYNPSRPAQRARKRGMTLVETMIALSISSLVIMSVLALQLITARTIKNMYGPTRARTERMLALNELRFRLADAKIGSCVVSESNHRIDFIDPTTGVDRLSAYRFDPLDTILYYDDNINESPGFRKVIKGLIDIKFTLGSVDLTSDDEEVNKVKAVDGAVTLLVRSSAQLAYADVDERDGETVICLRNP